MKTVKITANYGDGKFIAYNVPFECRYFVADQLVEMGAIGVKIGVPFVKTEELV
jgi:hypothetical protein